MTGRRLIDDDEFVDAIFTEVVWSQGVTEAGSSGGALATLGAGRRLLRSARRPVRRRVGVHVRRPSPDYYSHLEQALPLMREYLTPDADNRNGKVVVAVEFYNRGLDHYFLSTNPVEIDNLDSGRTVGWVRTGLRFLVYGGRRRARVRCAGSTARRPSAIRISIRRAPPNARQTAAAHPVDWIYESPSVFYVQLPEHRHRRVPRREPSPCTASSTRRRRITATRRSSVIRDEMRASAAWTPEGYGPGPYYPIMCAQTA